jgi:hypothetical protein
MIFPKFAREKIDMVILREKNIIAPASGLLSLRGDCTYLLGVFLPVFSRPHSAHGRELQAYFGVK